MSEHTKEPWESAPDGDRGGFKVRDCIRGEIAHLRASALEGTVGQQESNANRIVACVNNCEGLNPEAIPMLLEACERILDNMRRWPGTSLEDVENNYLIAAVKKAKE